MLRGALTLGAAVAVAGAVLASPLSAVAVIEPQVLSVPPSSVGADISYPQKNGPWPANPLFGIVGVNNGFGTHSNPYFAQQLDWASGTPGTAVQPAVSLYVNTENPVAADAKWWPARNVTRARKTITIPAEYGTCSRPKGVRVNTAACSYVYGYSIADDDFTIRGPADGNQYRWWLDVEVANDWTGGATEHIADLEGMVAAFKAHGATTGIYASRADWAKIVGSPTSSSSLAFLPSWIAGGSISRTQARAACERTGLTRYGRYALVQYVVGSQDDDVSCLPFRTTPVPTVTGSARVGRTLTADHGAWGLAGIRFAEQWQRNGVAIPGATGSTYRVQKADVGTALTVTVTATHTQYNTATVTSAPRTAHRAPAAPTHP